MQVRLFCILLTFFFVICSQGNVSAENSFPNHNGTCTNDFTNLIGPQHSSKIKSLCQDIFADELAVIVVYTVDSIPKTKKKYQDPVRYGTDLFNYWGIGRKGINDGLFNTL